MGKVGRYAEPWELEPNFGRNSTREEWEQWQARQSAEEARRQLPSHDYFFAKLSPEEQAQALRKIEGYVAGSTSEVEHSVMSRIAVHLCMEGRDYNDEGNLLPHRVVMGELVRVDYESSTLNLRTRDADNTNILTFDFDQINLLAYLAGPEHYTNGELIVPREQLMARMLL